MVVTKLLLIKRILLLFFLIIFLVQPSATYAASFILIKSEISDTVYYLDKDEVRHPFPNRAIYESWYGNDFSGVVILSSELIATYPLSTNVPLRSGHLLKVPSSPDVYVVEPGGVLRKFEQEDLVEHFFGPNWAQEVLDMPEVFFTNYILGDPITSSSDVPNGIIYQIAGEATIYWKDRDVLTRFADSAALKENNLNKERIFVNSQAFFTRNHIIHSKEDALVNPVNKPFVSNTDCAAEQLRAGIVYLHEGSVANEDLINLAMIESDFPSYWNTKSRAFSSITFPFPILLMETNKDNRFLNSENKYEVTHELGFNYFNTFSDSIDFLIVFTDFPVGDGDKAFFSPITLSLEGLGKTRLNRSALFGSQGKLKGIAVMGDLDSYSFFEQRRVDSLMNILAHELLHHWSGSLAYMLPDGLISYNLLDSDRVHWSPWATFTSPLGGKGWHAVTSSTAIVDETLSTNLAREFSELDLYAMGLLPYQVVSPVGYIDTKEKEPLLGSTNYPIKEVTIEDIIKANSPLLCVL